jgi:enterobacterial common antigen flippase
LESYLKGRGLPLASIKVRVFSSLVMLASIAGLYRFTDVMAIVQGALIGQIVCFIGMATIVYADSKEGDRSRIDRALAQELEISTSVS